MTRSRKRKLRRTGAALAGIPFASTMLIGASANAAGIPEIIVTATKREESLQKVPLAIEVLNNEKLTQLGVSKFDDYALLVPSLSLDSTGPGFERVYMRGVASGENGNHSGPLPSVGTYLDEQPITTIQGALSIHPYDLARVEVLPGPQGTLYGASSQAGTIRIITNKPNMDGFEAGYDVEGNNVHGGDFGYILEGFANIPLTSNMAVRLVGWYEHDAGYISNIPSTRTYKTYAGFDADGNAIVTGSTCVTNTTPVPGSGCLETRAHAEKNFNSYDTYGGRASLRIELNDRWTITPTLMGQEAHGGGQFFYEPALGDLKIARFEPDYTEDHWIQAALTVEGKIGNFDLTYNSSYLERHDRTDSDYSDYSYLYDQCCSFGAYWYTPTGEQILDFSQYINGKDQYKKLSHEIRLASPKDWRLRFVTGLFFQNQEHLILQNYKVNGLGSRADYPDSALSVTGWPDTIWLTDQIRVDRDYAWFTEVTYDLMPDKLALTLGARVFHTENSLRGFAGFGSNYSSNYEAKCFSTDQFRGGPCTNIDFAVDYTGYVPKATLTWNIDSERLAYFTYSRGFRPGGVNRRDGSPYLPDFLDNFELGWKTSWLDNSLRFNGALFYQRWSGIQYSTLPPGGNGLTVIRNVGEAQIIGLDSDITWNTPLDGLTVSTGLEWLFADELTQDYFSPDGGAPQGTRLPSTPDLKWNLIARYEFNVAGLDAHLQGVISSSTKIWADLFTIPPEGAPLADRDFTGAEPPYALVDFTAGVEKGAYSAELYVRNALDKRAQLARFTPCATQFCGSEIQVTPNQPRTIGIRFGQKFGTRKK